MPWQASYHARLVTVQSKSLIKCHLRTVPAVTKRLPGQARKKDLIDRAVAIYQVGDLARDRLSCAEASSKNRLRGAENAEPEMCRATAKIVFGINENLRWL